MCGIVGVLNHNNRKADVSVAMETSLLRLSKRGPDFQSSYIDEKVALGHARLSIIDTSASSNQPFWDEMIQVVWTETSINALFERASNEI